jgi:hypothetical protein
MSALSSSTEDFAAVAKGLALEPGAGTAAQIITAIRAQ